MALTSIQLARVNAMICEHLAVSQSQVVHDALFEQDLGANSLDMVELIMAVEDNFHIEFHEKITSDNLKKVQDLYDILDRWTPRDPLQEYAREIGISAGFTLESLIDSHRRLRAQAIEANTNRRKEIDEARDRAAAQAREEVLHGEYISMAELKTLTLGQIVNIINGDD